MKDIANNQLEFKLESLNSKTEEIYMNLTERFSELFKELLLGFEKSSKLVSSFEGDMVTIEKGESSGYVNNVITETKAVIQELIAETLHFFTEMEERDNFLFDSIKRGIENLTCLETRIENIREDSIEMEVICLNAIVAALKIGKNGQGFSYIAEELRKLSSGITTYIQNLTSQWEKTLSIFNTFRKTIENVQNFQYRFYSKFREKLNSSFESYNQDVKKVAEVLLGVINEANNIKRPLYGIMEEVQLQDIIKQRVMHVIVSLKEIKSDIATDSAENFLDKIFSIEKISDLSINLLDDVKAKIATSLTIFRDNLCDLDQIMCKVEKKRVVSLDFVNTEGYDGLKGDASKQMFSESAGVLEELLADIDRSMEEKERLSQDGNLIIRELKLLEVKFQDLSTILDRFYPIQVLLRIEIAKLRDLQDRTETVEEMTRFTARISANMEKAFKIIKETLARINPAIRQFTKEAVDETSVVKKINSQIKESY